MSYCSDEADRMCPIGFDVLTAEPGSIQTVVTPGKPQGYIRKDGSMLVKCREIDPNVVSPFPTQ
jgi:hypothetical protein